jgi:hypothetical protein
LSVLAVQTKSTSVALAAVVETSAGEVGGCESGVDTVTVAVAVLVPTLFEAVNRYVVV